MYRLYKRKVLYNSYYSVRYYDGYVIVFEFVFKLLQFNTFDYVKLWNTGKKTFDAITLLNSQFLFFLFLSLLFTQRQRVQKNYFLTQQYRVTTQNVISDAIIYLYAGFFIVKHLLRMTIEI